MTAPLRVYYSFSHEDVQACFQLRKRLRPWRKAGVFGGAGDEAPERTEPAAESDAPRHLADAEIVLLLVTPRYLDPASNMRREIRWAVARSEAGESWTIPVILEECAWHNEAFALHGALPGAGQSVEEWSEPELAWDAVVDGLLEVAWRIRKEERPPRPAVPTDPVLVQLTLDAVFESFDEPDWHRLMRNLRLATGDHDLRIRRVSRGSVVVDVECERGTADRLQELAQRRELHEILGHRVLRFRRRKLEPVPTPMPLPRADADPGADTLGLDDAFAASGGRAAAVGAATQPAIRALARKAEAAMDAREKQEVAAATAVIEEGEVYAEPADESALAPAPFDEEDRTAYPEVVGAEDPEDEHGEVFEEEVPTRPSVPAMARTASPPAAPSMSLDPPLAEPEDEAEADAEITPTRRTVRAMPRHEAQEPEPAAAEPRRTGRKSGLLWVGLLALVGIAVSVWALNRGPADEGPGAAEDAIVDAGADAANTEAVKEAEATPEPEPEPSPEPEPDATPKPTPEPEPEPTPEPTPEPIPEPTPQPRASLPSATPGAQPCGAPAAPGTPVWRNGLASCLQAIGEAPKVDRQRLHSQALAAVERGLPSSSRRERVRAPARLAFFGDSALKLAFTAGAGVAYPLAPELDVTLLASNPGTGAVLAYVRALGSDPRPAVGWVRASDLGLKP